MVRIFKRSGSNARNRRGSAVLEAALVFPILLGLTFGAIEYGYYFFVKNTLQGAAREGCRAGIVLNNTYNDIDDAVAGYLKAAGLNSSATTLDSKWTLTVESPSGTTITSLSGVSAGSALYVTVKGNSWGTVGSGFRPMNLISSSKSVTGVSVMRKEG